MEQESTFTLARAPQGISACIAPARHVRDWEILLPCATQQEAHEYALKNRTDLNYQEEFFWVAGNELTTIGHLKKARERGHGWICRLPGE